MFEAGRWLQLGHDILQGGDPERMFEAGRWLQLGHDILQGGDPVDFFLARIGLATALALQGRVDLARPCIERSSRFDRLCDGIVTVWGA
jgi:hypothetical protein